MRNPFFCSSGQLLVGLVLEGGGFLSSPHCKINILISLFFSLTPRVIIIFITDLGLTFIIFFFVILFILTESGCYLLQIREPEKIFIKLCMEREK